ncbi:MAG TPA: chemotaxis protein CheW [Casimicrobiaceae bacterium]
MTRAARLDLRSFQQELAARLATRTAAQVESSRLSFVCAGTQWLVRLADAGEVIAVPPIARVPLTRDWFLGLANVRGNLYSGVDFAAFTGAAPVPAGASARLLLFASRSGDLNAGLVVERVAGLRNITELAGHAPPPGAPDWYAQRWSDADGNTWQEVDLAALARDASFLQVGI